MIACDRNISFQTREDVMHQQIIAIFFCICDEVVKYFSLKDDLQL